MLVEDMRRLGHDLALSETAKLRTELEEVRYLVITPKPSSAPSSRR